MRTQRRDIGSAIGACRHHVGHQPLVAGLILARDDRRLRHARMPQQRRLDLAGLDAEAAHLHLSIGAPEEIQDAVGAPAREIPGAVHAAPGRPERVRHEAFRSQPGASEIAPRQPRARDVKLARNPGRHRLQAPVQHVCPKVRYAPANETACVCSDRRLVEREVADMHRRFGDAIHIDEMRSAVGVTQVPLVEPSELQRFTAKDHIA